MICSTKGTTTTDCCNATTDYTDTGRQTADHVVQSYSVFIRAYREVIEILESYVEPQEVEHEIILEISFVQVILVRFFIHYYIRGPPDE